MNEKNNVFRIEFMAFIALAWNAIFFAGFLGYLSSRSSGLMAIIFGLLWALAGFSKRLSSLIRSRSSDNFHVRLACLMGGFFSVVGGIAIWNELIP